MSGSNKPTVQVKPVTLLPTPMGCGMFLSDGEKTALIYIDPSIGASMNDVLRGDKPDRPQSHDFFYTFMQGMGATMVAAHIVREEDEVFYASAIFQVDNEVQKKQIVQLDCRPSDCISMAVRFDIPIYFMKEIWDRQPDVTQLLDGLRDQIEGAEEDE